MLTGDQMLVINKGWLVKHSDYVCTFVVVERDGDLLRFLQVNALNPINYYSLSVNDPRLSIVEIA